MNLCVSLVNTSTKKEWFKKTVPTIEQAQKVVFQCDSQMEFWGYRIKVVNDLHDWSCVGNILLRTYAENYSIGDTADYVLICASHDQNTVQPIVLPRRDLAQIRWQQRTDGQCQDQAYTLREFLMNKFIEQDVKFSVDDLDNCIKGLYTDGVGSLSRMTIGGRPIVFR